MVTNGGSHWTETLGSYPCGWGGLLKPSQWAATSLTVSLFSLGWILRSGTPRSKGITTCLVNGANGGPGEQGDMKIKISWYFCWDSGRPLWTSCGGEPLCRTSHSAGRATYFLRKKKGWESFQVLEHRILKRQCLAWKNVKAGVGYLFLEKFDMKFSGEENKACTVLSSPEEPVCLLVPFRLVGANILDISPEGDPFGKSGF